MHRISYARSSLKHPAAPGIPKIAAPVVCRPRGQVDGRGGRRLASIGQNRRRGRVDARREHLVAAGAETHRARLSGCGDAYATTDAAALERRRRHQQRHQLNQLTPQLVPSIPAVGGLRGLPFEAAEAASGRHRPRRSVEL